MISANLEVIWEMSVDTAVLRRPEKGRAMIVAAFSYRYDAHLVPALLQNISPSVHAWVSWDDRGAASGLTSDRFRQSSLIEAARNLGAQWILAADPDERYEDRLCEQIDFLTNDCGNVCWKFKCREMYSPTSYRTDGIWKNKPRVRLFPSIVGTGPDGDPLHGTWINNHLNLPVRPSNLNFYHLRMIDPGRRQLRRDLYAAADPERRYQAIGYDYLSDERGMTLEDIEPGREYSPLHIDDGQLWAPKIYDIGVPTGDAAPARLHLVSQNRNHGGFVAASYVAEDLFHDSPQDLDLGLLACDLALIARRLKTAEELARVIASETPGVVYAHYLHSRALMALGNKDGAHAAAKAALRRAPVSQLTKQQFHQTLNISKRFSHPNALWRRWLVGPARLHEGSQIISSEIAVVVIGFKAPSELAAAVSSVREQDEPAEIVVVNSGGGDARGLLSDHLDHIRLLEVEEPLFIGAARNIGIDASEAPYIAFLASDCRAQPGWNRLRMMHHRGGAAAVGNSVVQECPHNLVSIAAGSILHGNRWPQLSINRIHHYGLSYARYIFECCGYFPTGLRIKEDTDFNARIRKKFDVHWAPDVLTTHRYPTGIIGLYRDMHERGRRRAQYPPLSKLEEGPEQIEFLRARVRKATERAQGTVNNLLGLSAWRRLAVKALIWIAAKSDARGIARALPSLKKAETMIREADACATDDPRHALDLLKQATILHPQNWEYHDKLAELLIDIDPHSNAEPAIAALRHSSALAPARGRSTRLLCQLLNKLGRHDEALAEAEFACIRWPDKTWPWLIARRSVVRGGQVKHQCLIDHAMLMQAPALDKAHRNLAQTHKLMKKTKMAKRRKEHATALTK